MGYHMTCDLHHKKNFDFSNFKRTYNNRFILIIMKKITLLPPLLKTSKEIDNYVSQNFGNAASPECIKASWFAVANLYFAANDYTKAEKFLLQLLYYQPNDIKVDKHN